MEKEVYIIGGGPSLKKFDFELLSEKDTIVVNKSILDIPNANYFVTVDYTFLRKVGSPKLGGDTVAKVFVACLHFDYMCEEEGIITDSRTGMKYDLSAFDVIIKSRRADGIGYSLGDFRNGLNSGYCALQLAVILGYKKINLLGIDLQVDSNQAELITHYHGGYGQDPYKFAMKLEEYYVHFVGGLQRLKDETDIEVVSLSPTSRLNEVIPYRELKV